jgi:hypothetical protein
MEQRWIKAIPDQKVPKNKQKMPKFGHLFAKIAVFGHIHRVVPNRHLWIRTGGNASFDFDCRCDLECGLDGL